MPNKTEIQTDIYIDIALTEEEKLKCTSDMLSAMDSIDCALEDIKDYIKQKKEEIDKEEESLHKTKATFNNEKSDSVRLELSTSIISTLNAIAQLEGEVHSFQTMKKAEISQLQETVNVQRLKLNRGKDTKRMQVTMIKDFKANTKTYVRNDTGEVVRTLPMTEDDLQMDLEVVRE